jgi:uncharacterized membrane protein
MTTVELGLAASVFLACAVEAVEALTIVLAVGQSRDWPSALAGAGAAAAVLAGVVAGLGSALTSLPLDALRIVVGALLLLFGAQWLRKAILRAAGLKALHDEREEYVEQSAAARAAGSSARRLDAYSFAISFKGVLLEGVEVAVIAVTFGANQHRMALAAAAAGAAVLLVIAGGVALRSPLARVPENTLKFAVGVMLSSFGIFWLAEGAGLSWPGGQASLLALIGVLLGASLLAVAALRAAKLPASVGDDEVGAHADEETRRDQIEAEDAVPVAAHGRPDLPDHVQDRAARERVEEQLERLRVDLVADDRPQHRRSAGHEARHAEPLPGGVRAAQRPHDAEALGRVVQPEADDQHGREPDRAGLGRHPDREPLGEVVQADRDRHHHRRLQCAHARGVGALLRAGAILARQHRGRLAARDRRRGCATRAQPALDRGDAGRAHDESHREEREQAQHVAEARGVVPEVIDGRFEHGLAVLGHVHEDERQNPDREHREGDAHAVSHPAHAPQGQPQIDRETGDRSQPDRFAEIHRLH